MSKTGPIRVLIAKPGLDGHDRGAKVVAQALRDQGMEVIYTGLRQTPEMIVKAAVEEDVDAIGLSLHSGAHMTLFPRVRELMDEAGIGGVLLTGGGVIPEQDRTRLEASGTVRHHRGRDGRVGDHVDHAQLGHQGRDDLARQAAGDEDAVRAGLAVEPAAAHGFPQPRVLVSDPRQEDVGARVEHQRQALLLAQGAQSGEALGELFGGSQRAPGVAGAVLDVDAHGARPQGAAHRGHHLLGGRPVARLHVGADRDVDGGGDALDRLEHEGGGDALHVRVARRRRHAHAGGAHGARARGGEEARAGGVPGVGQHQDRAAAVQAAEELGALALAAHGQRPGLPVQVASWSSSKPPRAPGALAIIDQSPSPGREVFTSMPRAPAGPAVKVWMLSRSGVRLEESPGRSSFSRVLRRRKPPSAPGSGASPTIS